MAGDVRVVYRKYDGSLHWHLTTMWLGEDEHGIWTGAARPTVLRKGAGPPVTLEHASVMLFPAVRGGLRLSTTFRRRRRCTATSRRLRAG